ncbi:MAG: hypothetical protein ACU85E_18170 [Gammaproteobacteria bacterium]
MDDCEKKTESITFKTTPSVKRMISVLSEIHCQTESSFIHDTLFELLSKKAHEARLVHDALKTRNT